MGGLGHQVGPLLILFTGDHLIQGKFFQIKAAHRNILGWLLIGLSAFAWLQGWTSCLIPLLIFFVLTMISLLELSRKLKVESI
jgi:CHASE2 domain-containing sensor protein